MLTLASQNGHFDVVNRLLECKQIDVNMQMQVGENVCTSIKFICFSGIPQYVLKIVLYIICIHVGWWDSTDRGITLWALRCGQSVVGVQTN